MLKKGLPFLLLFLQFHTLHSQDEGKRWVDSVFSKLDRNAKVAQLFLIPVNSYVMGEERDQLNSWVKSYSPGGIYLTRGGPLSHARLVNQLQKLSKIPMLSGVSAEWGLSQTMDSVMGFQKPMVAAALKNDSLVWIWGTLIAKQMKVLGFQLNFAPNIDEEIFQEDYLRYFSNNPDLVAHHTATFTRALQSEGVLAVAKHLPRTWTTEPHSRDSTQIIQANQIDTASLSTLMAAMRAGVTGIAAPYLHFSIQQQQGKVPASLAQVFMASVLKQKLKYEGLVFSDIRDFEKKAGKIRPGEAERIAFESGADVLMNPRNLTASVRKLSKAIRKSKVLQDQLDISVRKILWAKYRAGLSHPTLVNADNLVRRLNAPEFLLRKHQLSEAAVTVVRNTDSILPQTIVDATSFISLSVGKDPDNEFARYLAKYAKFTSCSIQQPEDTAQVAVNAGDVFVVSIHPFVKGLERKIAGWVNRLSKSNKVILVHFGNPQSLEMYPGTAALIEAYTDDDYMSSIVPQVIFGAIPAKGSLPLDLPSWPSGQSLGTNKLDRLGYSVPEAGGLDSHTLERITSIMKEAIDMKATPGCHALVARNGKIVYETSEGWLTYDKKVPVTDETIYDLASVTKVSATLQTVMFMHERGLIDINKKVSLYLPELRNSNKKDFTIRDILTHQAGLWPFLPFWSQTMKDNSLMPEYYSSTRSDEYPYPVANGLYATKAMKDSLWHWIVTAKIREKAPRTPFDYRYSDMGFYILQHLAEKLLNQPMEDFLDQNLYGPVGAYTTGYLPLERFPAERIAPTEQDTLFRKSLLVGYVHDQGAAMHGGIAGHAGLFSTANDLAKLGQLWLQRGHYAGATYFKPETINFFTAKQFNDSRRGLGWDKPPPSDWSGPTTMLASKSTFGHTGFTGTCIWIDPEFDLVFIFLSNRVQPDMNNNLLLNANIRPRIHQVVYQAMFDYCSSGK